MDSTRPDDELAFLEKVIDQGLLDTLGPPADAAPEDRFGRYEIVARVGQGGAGSVFKARDLELNRTVALKVLDAVPTERTVQRFVREAQVMAGLRHPNIVSVFELIQDRGRHAIVMEFVEGATLEEELTRRTRPMRELVDILRKSAEALEFVHRHGVIHRDVKPGNIIVDARGEPRVSDFGLAAFAHGDAPLTLTGAWVGTPLYMAPEQARGASHDADLRTDVYALGVILYEILTGRLPHTGASAGIIIHRILNEEPPPPRSVDGRISRDLAVICMKAMEKRVERRYPSAAAMAADLACHLKGEPISARPPTLHVRARRFVARHRGPSAVLAVVLLAVAVGAAFWTSRASDARLRERLLRVERAGEEITAWDAHLYKRPEDVGYAALRRSLKGIEARLRVLESEDPGVAHVHFQLGRVQRRLGLWNEALGRLDHAIELEPASGRFRLERGLLKLRRWGEEYQWKALALRFFGVPEADWERALESPLFGEAMADFESSARLGLPPVHLSYSKAVLNLAHADASRARSVVDGFVKQFGRDEEAADLKAELFYFLASWLVSRERDARAAMEALDQALAMRRCFPEASALRAFCRGLTLGRTGPDQFAAEARRAAQDAGIAIELNPEHFSGYMAQGALRTIVDEERFKGGRGAAAAEILEGCDETLALLDRAIALKPDSAIAHFVRGRALMLRAAGVADTAARAEVDGRRREALAELDRVESLIGTKGWWIEHGRASLHILLGERDRARQAIGEAVRLMNSAGLEPPPHVLEMQRKLQQP